MFIANALTNHLLELFLGQISSCQTDNSELVGKHSILGKIVERGQQLAFGEVSRGTENDRGRRVCNSRIAIITFGDCAVYLCSRSIGSNLFRLCGHL